MTMTSITQIANNTLTLQTAGGAYAKDSFGVSCAAFALGAEAAFAPQNSLTDHLLGQIICRLHPRIVNKCPEVLPQAAKTIITTPAITIQNTVKRPSTDFGRRLDRDRPES